MGLEKHQRKTIKNMKKDELKKYQDDLFDDLEEVNETDQKLAK
jgi:hypothetical protein